MRTHINAPGVCHSGCKAIAIFTFASLHREVYERGGLKVLYDVLRAHINNKDITELCIQVILLFKSVPEANEEILSSESMALLLVALTNCGGDTEEMKSQFNITRNEN